MRAFVVIDTDNQVGLAKNSVADEINVIQLDPYAEECPFCEGVVEAGRHSDHVCVECGADLEENVQKLANRALIRSLKKYPEPKVLYVLTSEDIRLFIEDQLEKDLISPEEAKDKSLYSRLCKDLEGARLNYWDILKDSLSNWRHDGC